MAGTPPNPLLMQAPVEIKSEEYREVYSNFSRISITPWDLSIVFGKIDPSQKDSANPSVITETAIVMSPHQFKAFTLNLSLFITQWENLFGEIRLDDRFIMNAAMLKDAAERQTS